LAAPTMGAVTYGFAQDPGHCDLGHLSPTFVGDLLDRLDDGLVDVEVEAFCDLVGVAALGVFGDVRVEERSDLRILKPPTRSSGVRDPSATHRNLLEREEVGRAVTILKPRWLLT